MQGKIYADSYKEIVLPAKILVKLRFKNTFEFQHLYCIPKIL